MLVMTIAKYRRRTRVISPLGLMNVSQFGGHGIALRPPPFVLAHSALINVSQFGLHGIALRPPPLVLAHSTLVNFNQFGAHEVANRYPLILAHATHHNTNQFGTHDVSRLTPVETSYANPGGTGNRTGSIIATASSGLFAAGTPSKLIDGSTSHFDTWFNNSAASPWIKFDFGTARVIDAFRWYQSNNTNHGTWRWRGSNDDSSYLDVGSAFTLAGPVGGGSQQFTEPNGNTTAWRYWMMTRTGGNPTSGGPFLYEIEFKIF